MSPTVPIPSPIARRRPGARGFTLVELIVAIGATGLLVIGIGQVFSSVNRLVTTGASVSEVDQLARSIERQLRSDFASLSNLRAEDTFMAIRSRKIGDVDNDGFLDPTERAIYLTLDDREFDTRAGIAPYARNSDGTPISRAVTRRLDEIIFLTAAGTGGEFVSQQVPANGSQTPVRALAARLYYGHGLRPAPDNQSGYFNEVEQDPANPTFRNPNRPLAPQRRWIPDGDFGARAGERNEPWDPDGFDFNGGFVTGRNEFAANWLLLRQPLLLAGGFDAAGPPPDPAREPPPDSGYRYTPYVRDLEGGDRFGAMREPNDDTFPPSFPGNATGWAPDSDRNPEADSTPPYPRLNRFGRVDVCAQSLEGVRRWLEGQGGTVDASEASAFEAGRWNGLIDEDTTTGRPTVGLKPDSPLWLRVPRELEAPDSTYTPDQTDANQVIADTIYLQQSAIAGCFTRLLAESEPPFVNRQYRDQDAMDVHATIAAHCSNFEIAWTDGTVWPDPNSTHADGVNPDRPFSPPFRPDIKLYYGDIVWFDAEFTREEASRLADFRTRDLLPQLPSTVRAELSGQPDPEIIAPEGFTRGGLSYGVSPTNRKTRLLIPNGPPSGFGSQWSAYSLYDTFAAPSDPNAGASGRDPYADPNRSQEYLAIWGFRVPVARPIPGRPELAAEYGGAWRKPVMIRIRMTIHDSQSRLSGGRNFEFIMDVPLRAN